MLHDDMNVKSIANGVIPMHGNYPIQPVTLLSEGDLSVSVGERTKINSVDDPKQCQVAKGSTDATTAPRVHSSRAPEYPASRQRGPASRQGRPCCPK